MLPFLVSAPVIVFAIAAAALGISISTYYLIKDKTLSVEERLKELERLAEAGKISLEEFTAARVALFEKFAA